jgi:hypothetical protein
VSGEAGEARVGDGSSELGFDGVCFGGGFEEWEDFPEGFGVSGYVAE